jgi:5-methylthioadenosine/S-adenosylhomocysteine deaminase
MSQMSNWIITNALILPMTERQQSFSGYVRVNDALIAEIEAGAPVGMVNDEFVIDAAGSVLMPGLVNAHTHLYQVLLRAVWEDLELMPWLKRIYGCARVLRPEHFCASIIFSIQAPNARSRPSAR